MAKPFYRSPAKERGPAFSQRHYIAIALAMREAYVPDFTAQIGWNSVRLKLVHMFTEDNSKFDRKLFMEACLPLGRQEET